MVTTHPQKGGKWWFSVVMGHRGWVYWASAAGKMGGNQEKWRRTFPISFPNFPLVSTLFPLSTILPVLLPHLPQFPHSFPHFPTFHPPPLFFSFQFPPISPIFPFFLGNIVGYLLAGCVGDFWALPHHGPGQVL